MVLRKLQNCFDSERITHNQSNIISVSFARIPNCAAVHAHFILGSCHLYNWVIISWKWWECMLKANSCWIACTKDQFLATLRFTALADNTLHVWSIYAQKEIWLPMKEIYCEKIVSDNFWSQIRRSY